MAYPPKPIPTLATDPDDARLLENGLSVAENTNQGHFLYNHRLEDQKSGSMGLDDVWITHTIDENEATVQFNDKSSESYTRVETNVYQRRYTSQLCAKGTATLTYNRRGFTIYMQCGQKDTTLHTFELVSGGE